MKSSKKLSVFFMLLVLSILFIAPSTAKAATVGTALANPESGWQRIDEKDNPNIHWNGTWGSTAYSGFWGGTDKFSTSVGSTISFKFYGTKLRIIGQYRNDASKDTKISIDGVESSYTEYSATISTTNGVKYLVFEQLDMPLGLHSVVITTTTTSYTRFDAIDIDDSGYLVDVNRPTNLVATPGNGLVTLNWDAVDGATSYNIKRFTTAGGPYDQVGTSTTNSYIDSGLTNGVTYYYVVTAITPTGESSSSYPEVSATPSSLSNAILDIYLDNGMMKEYNVTPSELDAFITWYENKSNGVGCSYYIFTVKGTVSPFKAVKNYIPFSKILYFDVKEYE